MKAQTQKRLGIGLAVVLLAFVFFVQSVGPAAPGESEDPSSANYSDPGRRAAYLLLHELGFRVQPWRQPPSSLPRDGATLVLPAVPRSVFGRDDSSDLPDSPLAERIGDASTLDLHLPVHYRRFLDSGGVILSSAEEDVLEFLVEELALEDLLALEARDSELTETVLPADGTLAVDWSREFDTELLEPFTVWAASPTGVPQVVTLEVGRGELVLFADGSVLSNAALRDGDEGLLFVRAIEEFDRSGLILFDEYALGRWNPLTRSELALSGRFLQLTIQFLVLIGAFVWRLGWIGRFPRDPEPFELLSPLSRVRSQANLLERAGRYDILANWFTDGVVRRAIKSWRVRVNREKDQRASVEDLAELGRRAGIDGTKWHRMLYEVKISGPKDLASFEQSLSEFESEVTKSHSARRAREKVRREQ